MRKHQALRKLLKSMTPPIVLQVFRTLKRDAKYRSVKRKLEGQDRLHLACGNNFLKGWANIDLKSNGNVIGWDLTNGLPIATGAITYIFCEHFIEHITQEKAIALLTECHRVLRPDGILRLSTPRLRKLVDEYIAGRTSEWHDVGWTPATPCQMVNEGLRSWGHQFVYDSDELKKLLENAGFRRVTQVTWRKSKTPELANLECRPLHDEIIIEATKKA